MTCTRLTKGPGIARTQLAGVAGGYGCGKTLGLSLPITDRPRSSALFIDVPDLLDHLRAPSAQTATPAWTATERHSYTPLLILMTWAHHSTPGAGSCFRSSIIANQQLPTSYHQPIPGNGSAHRFAAGDVDLQTHHSAGLSLDLTLMPSRMTLSSSIIIVNRPLILFRCALAMKPQSKRGRSGSGAGEGFAEAPQVACPDRCSRLQQTI